MIQEQRGLGCHTPVNALAHSKYSAHREPRFAMSKRTADRCSKPIYFSPPLQVFRLLFDIMVSVVCILRSATVHLQPDHLDRFSRVYFPTRWHCSSFRFDPERHQVLDDRNDHKSWHGHTHKRYRWQSGRARPRGSSRSEQRWGSGLGSGKVSAR